jgi:hypothetical protein
VYKGLVGSSRLARCPKVQMFTSEWHQSPRSNETMPAALAAPQEEAKGGMCDN